MRLALLYHQFITRGGLEGYLREFAAGLKSAGHEVVLVTCKADGAFRSLAEEVRIIPPALTSRGTLAKFARESAALVPQLKVDAVLGFGRTWKQDLHRAGGGCHWQYSRMLPWWKCWKPKNRLELALERKLYTGGETRHFIVNSAKVRRELEEAYQVPPERVSVIHTAVDTDHWRPCPDAASRREIRKNLSIPDGAPALLFASLDHRRKGLPVLLRALAQVPEARLWVAGKPLQSWQGEIGRLGLAGRVTGIGRADLLPWFQAADWFVHPTRYDACANTVLQSMACGLPGIISAADGALEFIHEAGNGFILHDPTSVNELAASLRGVLGVSAAARDSMAAAARATVLPLTWKAHFEGWLRAIKNL